MDGDVGRAADNLFSNLEELGSTCILVSAFAFVRSRISSLTSAEFFFQ